MTPPRPPHVVRLVIPREDPPDPPIDPYEGAPDPDTARRVDSLISDSRERVIRDRRRARRVARVIVGSAARLRRIERGQWLLARDVGRLSSRSTVAAVAPVAAAVVYVLHTLFGG